jgi:hypothetical protein
VLKETILAYTFLYKSETPLTAEARKETIESLKKIISYLEAQLAESNQNKK